MSQSTCFEELSENKEVSNQEVPKHVAIIMDGNRRWATLKGLAPEAGHWKGAQTLTQVVESALRLGIKVLTVYAFSTENWARSKNEIESLFELFKIYLNRVRSRMVKKGVKVVTIGDQEPFPNDVKKALDKTKVATQDCENLTLVLALNYGGRDDLRRAMVKIFADVEAGKIAKEQLSEEMLSRYLDTAAIGDPDILIRTSGEKRISNFLLWQISYSEVYITDVLWPEFTEKHLIEAIFEFNKRDRRLGS